MSSIFGSGGLDPPPDSLQLEHAEPLGLGQSVQPCERCHNQINGTYYVIGGQPYCRACKEVREFEKPVEPSLALMARAALFGAGAALLGTLIYFAILALSGYEIGFIAIVVGWLVGTAVNRGSRGIGGWKLQMLAVALTYCSIVVSYVPLAVKHSIEQSANKAALGDSSGTTPQKAAPGTSERTNQAKEPVTFAGLLLGLGVLFAIALAIPFLAGFHNIFGLVIIGIGLFEAWKLNRRTILPIAGPFDTNSQPAP